MSAEMDCTDRYGGHPPSWLRGCFTCEAMGCYPEKDPARWPAGTRPPGTPELDGTPDDGWRFIRCPDRGGAARVPWWRTVLRVPRWLLKGVRFVWEMGVRRNKDVRPHDWTWWQEFRVTVAIAFLVDLGL